jgi:hypothetical protein
MPLILEQLEATKRLANGVTVARCPACAAAGHDAAGNHLKIFRSGQYACVVFPGKGGKEHRREIFRLVGRHGNSKAGPPLNLVYTVKLASHS